MGIHVKHPLFLSDFNETGNLSKEFSKNTQIPTFKKIRPVAAELFHADGHTGMTKIIVAFCNFANAPKMDLLHQHVTTHETIRKTTTGS